MKELESPEMKQFRENVVARLKTDIRDLLPESALNGLVEQAVRETFFKERTVPSVGGYGQPTNRPSWFVEEVAKVAEPILKAEVKGFVEERRPEIEAALTGFLTSQSLAVAFANELTATLQTTFNTFIAQMRR